MARQSVYGFIWPLVHKRSKELTVLIYTVLMSTGDHLTANQVGAEDQSHHHQEIDPLSLLQLWEVPLSIIIIEDIITRKMNGFIQGKLSKD